MPPFWPRVGEQDEDTIDRGRRQRRDQQACIVGENPNVIEALALYSRQQFCDSVLEYLAPDKAYLAVMLGLSGEMLTRAKTDLQPNRLPRCPEPGAGLQPTRRRAGQGDPGQQFAQQCPLTSPKRPPAAAPKERLPLRPGDQRRSEHAP